MCVTHVCIVYVCIIPQVQALMLKAKQTLLLMYIQSCLSRTLGHLYTTRVLYVSVVEISSAKITPPEPYPLCKRWRVGIYLVNTKYPVNSWVDYYNFLLKEITATVHHLASNLEHCAYQAIVLTTWLCCLMCTHTTHTHTVQYIQHILMLTLVGLCTMEYSGSC